MKKAVLMCRVSSDEQAKGYSLDVQEEQLKAYCKSQDIEILKVYREDHSAKNFDRPEFKRFMQEAKRTKARPDLLLFTTWDRFSRNIRDSLNVLHTLKELGIKPLAIQQPIDLDIPENLAVLSFYLAIPEIDNTRRSIKIKEGMRKALEKGHWCRPAPKGYRNARDDDNRPVIVPASTAGLVRLAFKEIAKGKSQVEVRHMLKDKGFIVTKSAMPRMLRNPVYMGKIQVPAEARAARPAMVEGRHKAIVSEKLFYEVQNTLAGKSRSRLQATNSKHKEALPLRGSLVCSKCGLTLTGSASRSHTGRRYHYYHCNHCHKERLPAGHAHTMIKEVLEEFKFKREVKELYSEMLSSLRKDQKQTGKQSVQEISKKINQLKNKLEKLQDLLTEEKLDYQEYHEMTTRYKSELSELEVSIQSGNEESTKLKRDLKTAVNMLSNLGNFYDKADSRGKQQLISSIFPENLSISENQCRTQRINEVLHWILTIDKGLKEKRKGYFTNKLEVSHLVVRRGIERIHLNNRVPTC